MNTRVICQIQVPLDNGNRSVEEILTLSAKYMSKGCRMMLEPAKAKGKKVLLQVWPTIKNFDDYIGKTRVDR